MTEPKENSGQVLIETKQVKMVTGKDISKGILRIIC